MHTTLRLLRAVLLLLCVAALAAGQALAWSGGGHKVVALIAYSQLDPATRTKIVGIIKAHPRWAADFAGIMPANIKSGSATERERWIFAQAAIWPDLIRDNPQYNHGSWHFINEPIFLDAAAKQTLGGHLTTNLNYNWKPTVDPKTQNAPQTVKMAIAVLKDPKATAADKAVMMCWLLHVVGDLHQPLHSVALVSVKTFPEGDRGGNSVILLQQGNKFGTPMHSFWDHLHGVTVTLSQASATMHSILSEPGIKEQAADEKSTLNVKRWVSEAKKAAEQSAYTPEVLAAAKAVEAGNGSAHQVTVTLSQSALTAYGTQAGPVASVRAAIGGYRLAEILKKTVK